MEEDPENSKESTHSVAHANGMNYNINNNNNNNRVHRSFLGT
jgi:hypothetical protein